MVIKNKSGVSPVIATVLLIAMVVVIGLIIFLWISGMVGETITKFGGTNIQLVCNDVQFDASYSGTLSVSNIGNVPLFGMKIKISGEGSYETRDLREFSNWPDKGLNQGGVFSEDISSLVGGDAEEITLIPVLMGTSKEGEKTYVCEEKQHGYEIVL